MTGLLKAPWLASLVALLLVGGLMAGYVTAQPDDTTYTGCLSPGGNINRVAVGDEARRLYRHWPGPPQS